MMRWLVICAAALSMTACQTMAENDDSADMGYPVVDRTGEGRDCAAPTYQTLIGQPISEVHTDSLPSPRRIYAEGDPVTMDHRPDRLNIITDRNGVVVAVRCG
ncbi:hypothetical protein F1654_03935 [Alkalicaulis satelles]|uniref:Peptidase inhibitor I78 family protein n=1 Tax=Alkalicaulis satelles TaxID=2609175 RepID=A0A5M6ZNI2_9PROT|nr:I78 family peptidase inhibitor [Alkalicaulis satelles]KAA5805144.1 hypothetical protein F1654_03935 [Alkalicaulis satelles]